MRASEASELRKFWYFYILKLLFLSIFCRYIRYFVGTNDMLVGLHVPTNFPMYRQISKCTDKSPKRHYWGGGGQLPPPPAPPLATLMLFMECSFRTGASATQLVITSKTVFKSIRMHGFQMCTSTCICLYYDDLIYIFVLHDDVAQRTHAKLQPT